MKRSLLVPLFSVVLMIIVMRLQGAALVTAVCPRGIVDLEFAWNNTRFDAITGALNHDDIWTNLVLDFLFIASYRWFLVIACRRMRPRYSTNAAPAFFVIFFVMLTKGAALLDVIENSMLMLRLAGNTGAGLLPVAGTCAAIKFGTIAAVLLFLLYSVLFRRKGEAPNVVPAV
jgi:hypothetical protein